MNKVIVEIPDNTTSDEMDKCVKHEDDDEIEITAENEDDGIIHRDITEY